MDKERLFRYLDRKYSSKSEIIPNIPLGVDADAIWSEILQSRRERGIELPLVNVNGDAYWYILTNKMISASEVIVDELLEQESTAEPHKSSVSTIEEIYYTGFMEGAQISVQDAMDFLQSGTEPSSVEELILINSRQAAGFAAENMYHAIDSNYLHNLAYFLTDGLENGGGDYRITDTMDIPSLQGETVKLPPANMIPDLVNQITGFIADSKTHPLIKAAAAQAWVLAVRPFPEGNERLARILSSVILIRAGYSFFGEISISSIIARTSYEYFRAIANILRVENGADLTYFLEYYLVALSDAVNEMKAKRKQQTQDMIMEEQRQALLPLSMDQTTVTKQNHGKGYKAVGTAMKKMKEQGISTFSNKDNQPDFNWGQTIYTMCVEPVHISGSNKIMLSYKSGATDIGGMWLVPKSNQQMSEADTARYIYEAILNNQAVSVPFGWLGSVGNYINVLHECSGINTGEYYLAWKAVTDNTSPMIRSVKVVDVTI